MKRHWKKSFKQVETEVSNAPVEKDAPRFSSRGRLAVACAFMLLASYSPVDPQIVLVSGNGQSGVSGETLAQPLVGQLLDQFGIPVPGAPVVLTAPPGGGFKVPDLDGGTINTAAGGGNYGDGGPATSASLSAVEGLATFTGTGFITCTAEGHIIVSDSGHSLIRRIDSAGIITRISGNGATSPVAENVPALSAALGFPTGVACDGSENLFFIDETHRLIRVIDKPTQTVNTYTGNGSGSLSPDGTAAAGAAIGTPTGLAFDAGGNMWFKADAIIGGQNQGALVRIDAALQTMKTEIAGLGTGGGIAIDLDGSILLCEASTHRVRRWEPSTQMLTDFAGNGQPGDGGDGGIATDAQVSQPVALAMSASGEVYIASQLAQKIRKVDVSGAISTFAGPGAFVDFVNGIFITGAPFALSMTADGDLLMGLGSGFVKKVTASTGAVTIVAGNGSAKFSGDDAVATSSNLNAPRDVALDAEGRQYIADTTNGRVRRIENGTITTVIGGGTQPLADGVAATSVVPFPVHALDVEPNGDLLFATNRHELWRLITVMGTLQKIIDVVPPTGGFTPAEFLTEIRDVAAAPNGDLYYLLKTAAILSGTRLERIAAGQTTPTTMLTMDAQRRAIAIDPAGFVFVASSGVGDILEFRPQTGAFSTIATVPAEGIEIDPFGHMYVARTDMKLAWVNRATGVVTDVAGTGVAGYSGDGGPALQAQLAFSSGLAVEPDADLFVADTLNDRVRIVTFPEETVSQFTVFTDSNGLFTFPPVVVAPGLGGQQATASATVNSIPVSNSFGFTAVLAQGTPTNPDASQPPRVATNNPHALYPRWWAPTNVIPTFSNVNPPPPAQSGAGGSHQRIAVDRAGVVHAVFGQTFRVVYVNSRPDARKGNGFSSPIDVTFDGTFTSQQLVDDGATLNVHHPVLAVNPIDNVVHVAWLEEYQKPSAPSPADQIIHRIVYRRLSQNPSNPGWTTRQVVHEVHLVTEGKTLSSPHVDVDAGGIAHIGFMEMTVTTTAPPDPQTPIVETTTNRVLRYSGTLPAEQIDSQTVTKTTVVGSFVTYAPAGAFLPVGDVIVRRGGPDGLIHLAWQETKWADSGVENVGGQVITGEVTDDEMIRHIVHRPPTGGEVTAVVTSPGLALAWDFDVGLNGPPQFVYATQPSDEIDPFKVSLYHKHGTSGFETKLVGPGDGTGFAAYRTTLARPGLAVDSRGFPHVFWGATVTTVPANFAGYTGAGLVYATQPNPGSGMGWQLVEPVMHAHQGTFDFRIMGGPDSVTVAEDDSLHLISATWYSRTFEPNLGAQDPLLAFDVAPGTSVNVGTGNVFSLLPIFESDGKGFSADVSLVYNSLETTRGAFSRGWLLNYGMTLTDHLVQTDVDDSVIKHDLATLQLGDGRYVVFRRERPRFGSPTPYFADGEYAYFSKLERLAGSFSDTDGSGGTPISTSQLPSFWRLTTKLGLKFIFDAGGHLTHTFDTQAQANKMVFKYEPGPSTITNITTGDASSVLTKITDSANRETILTYNSDNQVLTIKDPGQKTYECEYDASGRLKDVKFLLQTTWTFLYYDVHAFGSFGYKDLIATIRTPRGNDAADLGIYGWELDYYKDKRFACVTEPVAEHIKLDAEPPGGSTSAPAVESVAATVVVTYQPDPLSETPDAPVLAEARFTNRRFFTTRMQYEPRRQLPRFVTDPYEKTLERRYENQAVGTAPGVRNVTTAVAKRQFEFQPIETKFEYHATGPEDFEHVRDNVMSVLRPIAEPISAPNAAGIGEPTVFEYGKFNRVSKIKHPFPQGAETVYTVDPATGNISHVLHPETPRSIVVTSGGSSAGVPDPLTASNAQMAQFNSYPESLNGRAKFIKSPEGAITEFDYDLTTGLVNAIQRPARDPQKPEKPGYDVMGNLTSLQRPMGGTTTLELDDLYRIKTRIESGPPTATTVIKYNKDSDVIETKDPREFTTKTTYDRLGRVKTISHPEKAGAFMEFYYDREGNVGAVRDFRGFVHHRLYDKLDRLIFMVRQGDPSPDTGMATHYDDNDNIVRSGMGDVDKALLMATGGVPDGTVSFSRTDYFYDARDRQVLVTYSDQSVYELLDYDANDNLISKIRFGPTGAGGTSVLSAVMNGYDARERMIVTADAISPIIEADSANAIMAFRNNVLSQGAAAFASIENSFEWAVTRLGYDLDGNRTVVRKPDRPNPNPEPQPEDPLPDKSRIGFIHDLGGREIATVSGNGFINSVTVFNDDDEIVESFVPAPDPPPIGFIADSVQLHPISGGTGGVFVTGLVRSLKYERNDRGAVTKVENALGKATSFLLDEADNAAKVTPPGVSLGQFVGFKYDAFGHRTEMKQSVNEGGLVVLTTTCGYDENGNLVSIQNPEEHIFTMTYDAANRRLSRSSGGVVKEAVSYDALSRVVLQVKGGLVVTQKYDLMGNLASRKTFEPNRQSAFFFKHDGAGNLLEVFNQTDSQTPGQSFSFTAATQYWLDTNAQCYDRLGRNRIRVDRNAAQASVVDDELIAVTGGVPAVFQRYRYDRNSNINEITDLLSGRRQATHYDGTERVLHIRVDKDGAKVFASAHQYDKAGRTKETSWLRTGEGATFCTEQLRYTALGQLRLEIITTNPGKPNESIRNIAYGYDDVGNETSVNDTHAPHGPATRAFLPIVNWLKHENRQATLSPPTDVFTADYTYRPTGNRKTAVRTAKFSGTNVTTTTEYDYNADDEILSESGPVVVSFQPPSSDELSGAPIVDSNTAAAALVTDGVTTDSADPQFVWKSQSNAVSHFAGVDFGAPASFTSVKLFLPTLFVNGSASVAGQMTPNAPAIALPPVDAQVAAAQATNDNATIGQTDQGTNPLKPGPKLELKNNETLTLAAGTYFFTAVTVKNQAQLKVSGPVRILTTGQLTARDDARVNDDGPAADLLVASTTVDNHHLRDNARVRGLIDSPNGVVTVKGGAHLYGAALANEVRVEDNARVHYVSGVTSHGPYLEPGASTFPYLEFAVFGSTRVVLKDSAVVDRFDELAQTSGFGGNVYSGPDLQLKDAAFVNGNLTTTAALPGQAQNAGLSRFKFQALVGGTWTDLSPTSITGAQSNPTAPGWLQTVTPAPHVVTATVAGTSANGVRVLMDAGGGSPGKPNQLFVNEVDAIEEVPGAPIFASRTVGYQHDDRGNVVKREVLLDGSPVMTETFGYDWADRAETYVREEGGAIAHAWSFMHGADNPGLLARTDLLSGVTTWSGVHHGASISEAESVAGTEALTPTRFYPSMPHPVSRRVGLVDGTDKPSAYVWDGGERLASVFDEDGQEIYSAGPANRTAWDEPIPGMAYQQGPHAEAERKARELTVGPADGPKLSVDGGTIRVGERTYSGALEPECEWAPRYGYELNAPDNFVIEANQPWQKPGDGIERDWKVKTLQFFNNYYPPSILWDLARVHGSLGEVDSNTLVSGLGKLAHGLINDPEGTWDAISKTPWSHFIPGYVAFAEAATLFEEGNVWAGMIAVLEGTAEVGGTALGGYLAKAGLARIARSASGPVSRAAKRVGRFFERRPLIPADDPLVDNSILTRIADGDPEALKFAARNKGLLSTIESVRDEFLNKPGRVPADFDRLGVQLIPEPKTTVVARLMAELNITSARRRNDIALLAAAIEHKIGLVTADHDLLKAALTKGGKAQFRIFQGTSAKRVAAYAAARKAVVNKGLNTSPHRITGSGVGR